SNLARLAPVLSELCKVRKREGSVMRQGSQRWAVLAEAEGFYHGSQGISAQFSPERIDAQFSQLQERARADAVREICREEARLPALELRHEQAEAQWQGIEGEVQPAAPAIVMPLLAALSAAVVAVGEAVFLAPVMDGFGIADPSQQATLAAVLVLTCSGLLKISIEHSRKTSRAAASSYGLLDFDKGDHTAGRSLPS